MSWYNEPRRHGLSAKGIKTAIEGKPLIDRPSDYVSVMVKDNHLEEYKEGKKILRIYQDDDYIPDPREWDNLGIMACSHKEYALGDEKLPEGFSSWEEAEEYLVKEKGAIGIRPLYLYDHSGLRMKIGSFVGHAQHAEWDSGQVGFIYTTKKRLEETGVKEKYINESLNEEVITYDDYLSGNVYGFKVFEKKNNKWEETDSCGGFYGSDHEKSGLFDHAGFKNPQRID